MSRTVTRGGAPKSGARALVFGIIFSVVLFLATSLIGAVILSRVENPTAHTGLCGMIALFVTAAASGFATSRYKGDGGMLPAVLSALFVSLIMLMIGLVRGNGGLPLLSVTNLGAFMLISTIFAALGRKRERKRRRK